MDMIARDRLTKRFLMSLPAGTYLVSNCSHTPGKHVPRFHERVGPMSEREAQWRRIKAARADGSLCDVRESDALTSSAIARAKLTKRFLMAQPEGAFVNSNQFVPAKPGQRASRFEEYVEGFEAREAQWKGIKAAGADGRTCNVYNSPEGHARWLAKLRHGHE